MVRPVLRNAWGTGAAIFNGRDTGCEVEMHERVGEPGAPIQAGCEMRTTSPGTGSVNDVCVVTLLHVVVDVTVAQRATHEAWSETSCRLP